MSANLATILTDTAETHGDKTAFKLDDIFGVALEEGT